MIYKTFHIFSLFWSSLHMSSMENIYCLKFGQNYLDSRYFERPHVNSLFISSLVVIIDSSLWNNTLHLLVYIFNLKVTKIFKIILPYNSIQCISSPLEYGLFKVAWINRTWRKQYCTPGGADLLFKWSSSFYFFCLGTPVFGMPLLKSRHFAVKSPLTDIIVILKLNLDSAPICMSPIKFPDDSHLSQVRWHLEKCPTEPHHETQQFS